jgi:hypothetical protein
LSEYNNEITIAVYKLQHLGPHDDPKQLSGQYQGDMVLTQEQLDYNNEYQINPNTVLVNPVFHWPDAVIPYEIVGTFSKKSDE